jgi:hypothetical protein
MLVQCNLHNLRKLSIKIRTFEQLFDLKRCKEFKIIRRPHIILDIRYDDEEYRLEDSDVFKAFPDVKFTISGYEGDVSIDKAIDFHKENQNVLLEFKNIYKN